MVEALKMEEEERHLVLVNGIGPYFGLFFGGTLFLGQICHLLGGQSNSENLVAHFFFKKSA